MKAVFELVKKKVYLSVKKKKKKGFGLYFNLKKSKIFIGIMIM